MPSEGTPPESILSNDEPAPFRVLNPTAEQPMLLVCDHASRRIPTVLGDMGVDSGVRRCHYRR